MPPFRFRPPSQAAVGPAWLTGAMVAAVALANVLMPIELLPSLSAGTPVIALTFLINELAHRRYGPQVAKSVVWRGFLAAGALSAVLAPARVALASATAFLGSQLLDIAIFRRLRRTRWWLGPLLASVTASTIDTAVFFLLAFAGTSTPWLHFAAADWAVKLGLDLFFLLPFRAAMGRGRPKGAFLTTSAA